MLRGVWGRRQGLNLRVLISLSPRLPQLSLSRPGVIWLVCPQSTVKSALKKLMLLAPLPG